MRIRSMCIPKEKTMSSISITKPKQQCTNCSIKSLKIM